MNNGPIIVKIDIDEKTLSELKLLRKLLAFRNFETVVGIVLLAGAGYYIYKSERF